jgi:hypothetical protein
MFNVENLREHFCIDVHIIHIISYYKLSVLLCMILYPLTRKYIFSIATINDMSFLSFYLLSLCDKLRPSQYDADLSMCIRLR